MSHPALSRLCPALTLVVSLALVPQIAASQTADEAEATGDGVQVEAVDDAAEAQRLAEEEAARVAAEAEAEAEAETARLAEIATATAACMDAVGPPSAQEPVSQAAQAARFDALRDGRADCTRAVDLDPEAGGPLFHLATIAQARARHDEAVALYERAAEAGIAAAHTRLGDYHNFGIGRIRPDVDQAVEDYRTASAMGDPAGTTTLAFMYRLGRGVPRDSARMVELFRTASDQGYHFAQYQLALTYLNGEGIPGNADASLGIPDAGAAIPLFEAAAEQGYLQAALDLAQLYAEGADGVEADPAAQFTWTDRAAEAGFPAAIAARGYLLEQGLGVAPDPDRAAADYIAALETGEVEARDLRDAGGPNAPRWDAATARAFQEILRDRGLYTGPIDGLVGRGTLGAADQIGG